MGLHREDALAVKYLRLVLCVTPEHVRDWFGNPKEQPRPHRHS